MSRLRGIAIVAVALAFFAAARSASAAPVTNFGNIVGVTLATTGDMVFSLNSGTVTGVVREDVILDSASGKLDFLYQLKNVSSVGGDELELLTGSNFKTYFTAIGIAYDPTNVSGGYNFSNSLDATFTPPLLSPDSVNESVAGVANFHFIANAIPSGSSSVILVVKTSATSYGGGSIFIQDGGNVTLSGFAPAPLPATANMGLVLLLGLGGIGGIRKMRAIRAVA